MTLTTCTALVLSGGTSRRFGADKTSQPFGGTTVLGHLVDALPIEWPVVVVGDEVDLSRAATWTREVPAGGGPLAAVAAGLALVTTDLVVVVAGDMPLAAPLCLVLADALTDRPDVDAVAARMGDGRSNPLLAAYRTDVARLAMPADPANLPARVLLTALVRDEVVVDERDAVDVDTPPALDKARRRLAT